MNSVISVTSSAPAYVFKFIKAICDGADSQGLDSATLVKSVCNMVVGSALMLSQSDKTPEELVAMVCSKGGTTEKAVAELDRYNFEEAVISAMQKCTERADELSALGK
jgi:pyrroline-5-carboxylate reductase